MILLKVLKPTNIINEKEMCQQGDDPWAMLYDENSSKEMFKMTVEEFGTTMNVDLEGTLERINPILYTGK